MPTTARIRADACPGVLSPHPAADGALARVRLPGGTLGAGAARAVADLADDAGDGAVHLTSRGNLQLRGLDPDDPRPVRRLSAAGLLPSTTHERVRNVLASPLSGLSGGLADVRGLAAALDRGLCARPALTSLPGRFLFAVDDGRRDVAAERPDLCWLARSADDGELLVAGTPTGLRCGPADAPDLLLDAAEAFLALRAEHVTDPSARAWRCAELPSAPARIAARLDPVRPGSGRIGPNQPPHPDFAPDRTPRSGTLDSPNVPPDARLHLTGDRTPRSGCSDSPNVPLDTQPHVTGDRTPRSGCSDDANVPLDAVHRPAPRRAPHSAATDGATTTPPAGTGPAPDRASCSGGPDSPNVPLDAPPHSTHDRTPRSGAVDSANVTADALRAVGRLGGGAVGAAPVLGEMSAARLRLLADLAPEVLVTPWRTVVLPAPYDAEAAVEVLRAAGFVVEEQDPALRVSACAGKPGCAKSLSDVRTHARALIATRPERPVHVSGCARRCGAPHGPHTDMVATGPDTYEVEDPR